MHDQQALGCTCGKAVLNGLVLTAWADKHRQSMECRSSPALV